VLTVLFNPRDPGTLRWLQSGMMHDAPAGLAALGARLNARGAELRSCTAGISGAATSIDKGSVVDLRLVPQSGSGPQLRVEIAQQLDLEVVHCVAQRAAALLEDVRIDRTLHLAVLVPDAAFPEGKPTLDKAVIRQGIHRNIGSVRECYQAALEVWPRIHGSVTVRFAIDSNDGRVLDARVVADDIGKPALACCIARNVYGWQFAGNGVKAVSIVTYPFILETAAE
jgi:hypothetical protein